VLGRPCLYRGSSPRPTSSDWFGTGGLCSWRLLAALLFGSDGTLNQAADNAVDIDVLRDSRGGLRQQ
jgi:hypothetical protein